MLFALYRPELLMEILLSTSIKTIFLEKFDFTASIIINIDYWRYYHGMCNFTCV